MVFKLINAIDAKSGATILVEGQAYIVKTQDVSKTGKHGAAKCRIEAIGILDGKKKIIAVPGHERLEVPMIEKKRAQVLSVTENMANVMDLESFETMDIPMIEELVGQVQAEDHVEYWVIDQNQKIIKRKNSNG